MLHQKELGFWKKRKKEEKREEETKNRQVLEAKILDFVNGRSLRGLWDHIELGSFTHAPNMIQLSEFMFLKV